MKRLTSSVIRRVPVSMVVLLLAFWLSPTIVVAQHQPDWTVYGATVDKLGEAVAGVGDVNGDGFADAAVVLSGDLYLFLGTAAGLPSDPSLTDADLGDGTLFFPRVLAAAGDVNNDGYDDFLAGAPFEEESTGAVRLYYGHADGEAPTFWQATGATIGSEFGFSVAGGGDVNGDGYDDVVIGAPGSFLSELGGVAFLYLGSADGLADRPQRLEPTNGASGRFGDVVALAGDVNGDGLADILVDDSGADLVHVYAGRADGQLTAPIARLQGEQYDYIFGNSLARVGDVNGDGFSDFALTAANIDDTWRVYLYYGSPRGPGLRPNLRLVLDPDTDMDAVVSRGGDLNGDGYADLVLGFSPPTHADEGTGTLHVHYGGPDGLARAPAVILTGPETSDGFGLVLDVAGDLNGDGYDDLIVGAPGSELGGRFAGAAYGYWGSAVGVAAAPPQADRSALALHAIWSAAGSEADALFGYQAVAVGDVNDDGWDDLLITAPGVADFQGTAELFLGTPAGLAQEPSWRWTGESTADGFGYQVAAVGDVNGDGRADLLIAAPLFADVAGKVYLFAGAADGFATEPLWSYAGRAPDTGVGAAIAGLGDLNGDGFADLAVVVAERTDADEFLRRVQIFLGGPDGPGEQPDWETAAEDAFGHRVAAAGDLNGDGFADFLVTPYMYDEYQGATLIYHGGRDQLARNPVSVLVGNADGENLGWSIAGVGDVNNDGFADVAVGVPGLNDNRGALYLYLGGPTGIDETAPLVIDGVAAATRFGDMVAPAGDLNADGFADVVVAEAAAPDGTGGDGVVTAYLYFGASTGLLMEPAAQLTVALDDPYTWGARVSAIGDLNADGYDDLIIGEPGAADDASGGKVTILAARPGALLPDWQPTSTWTARGSLAAGLFGWPALVAGDLDGDGYADLVAGEFGEVDGLSVSQMLGYPGGPDFTQRRTPAWSVPVRDWSLPSSGSNEETVLYLPFFAGAVGDINGDGLADLALGAMDAEFQQTVIALFAGNEDGPSATPLWTMNGSAFDDAELFGFSLAGAGDVNGDGFADLAVFATLPDSDAIAHLRVFHGGEEGLAPVPDWQLENLAPLEGVVGMAGVGDVNGDGFADFLVGEPGFPAGERLGKVTLYAGSPTGLASAPIWTHVGVDAGAGLGMAVAGLGDVNGDDVPDFAYSAPGSGAAGGVVTIVLVDPAELDASTVVTLPARPDARYWGVLLDGVGDVNADGFADFVVGHAAGDSFAHPVWSLFLGGADGPSPTPAYDLTNATTGELLVYGSVNGGDLNGDGYSDFAVGEADFGALGTTQGESGYVAVYLGGPSWVKATRTSVRPAGVQTDTVEDDEAGDVQPDGPSAGVDSTPVLDVLVDRLNVRSGPGLDYPVIAQADTGARFAVEGQADECQWLLVRDVDGNRGWLSADAQFVKLETPCAELEPIERRALDDAPSE